MSGLCTSSVESGRRYSKADTSEYLTSPKPTSIVAGEVEVEKLNSSTPPEEIDSQGQPLQRSSKMNQEQHSNEAEMKLLFGTNGFDPYVMVKAPKRKPW